MTTIKTWMVPSCLLLASMALSGCFSRQLVRFGVHDQKQVVLIETVDTNDYWLWADREHVFWSCAEQGEALQCTRRCGEDSDLTCPELSIFHNAVGTNVR